MDRRARIIAPIANLNLSAHSLRRLAAVIVVLAGVAALWRHGPGRGAVPPQRVEVRTPRGGAWQVEVADTPARRAVGLSGRRLPLRLHGLLLVFPASRAHGIWMKDMTFALDLVWIDGTGRVLAIIPHAPPCRPERACPVLAPAAAQTARYVLELAAGAADAERITPGTALTMTLPAAQ